FFQLPAILAVVWHYRAKIAGVVRTLGARWESRRLADNLVIGTLPAVVIRLPTDRWVEEHLYSLPTLAVALVIGCLLILWSEPAQHRVTASTVDDIPVRIALGVGLIQVLAVIFPGMSRSGATIMGGLVLGMSRVAATEFSFFLAIPAMTGATAIKLWEARDALSLADAPVFALGGAVSFVSALLVIRALLAFVSNNTFRPFAWYRIALGLLLLVWYWS